MASALSSEFTAGCTGCVKVVTSKPGAVCLSSAISAFEIVAATLVVECEISGWLEVESNSVGRLK